MRRYVLAAVTLLLLVSLHLVNPVAGWVGMLIVNALTFWRLGHKHASSPVEARSFSS
jgi:hypothetical protein